MNRGGTKQKQTGRAGGSLSKVDLKGTNNAVVWVADARKDGDVSFLVQKRVKARIATADGIHSYRDQCLELA